MPVDTARRTVRSGAVAVHLAAGSARRRHSSVSRSITARSGSRATSAPLRAPTLVPSTRSGVMLALEQRPQHADLDRAEHAAAAEHERGRHVATVALVAASSGFSAATCWATTCSTQKISSGTRPATSIEHVNPIVQPALRDSRNATTT